MGKGKPLYEVVLDEIYALLEATTKPDHRTTIVRCRIETLIILFRVFKQIDVPNETLEAIIARFSEEIKRTGHFEIEHLLTQAIVVLHSSRAN